MRETVLITGVASGIGREFANIFASRGYDLVLVGRNLPEMERMKSDYEARYGVSVLPIRADLSVDDEPRRVYEEVRKKGIQVTILINNAGVGDYGRFVDIPWERERKLVGLNVLAVMQFMHLYAADMAKQGGGKILNVASIAAWMPGPYMPTYFASKSFVYSLSQAVAKEMEGTGVTVTCLCPGPTATNFEKEAGMGKESKMFTLFKPMTPQEVAMEGYRALMKGEVVHTTKPLYRVLHVLCRLASEKWKRDLTQKVTRGY